MVTTVLSLLFLCVSVYSESQVCFEVVGCFSLKGPWELLYAQELRPRNPAAINTRFHYFSPSQINQKNEIFVRPEINFVKIHFDISLPTMIVVHDIVIPNETWMWKFKNEILERAKYNMILVTHGIGGDDGRVYGNAVSDARVVAREIALLLKHITSKLKGDIKRIHLIGHGLGASIVTYAAKEVRGIGRITALDPIKSFFEPFFTSVHLNTTDAKFVEIIHTDIKKIGDNGDVGHVNYYINQGYAQPGCEASSVPLETDNKLIHMKMTKIKKLLGCAHHRVVDYYIQSVKKKKSYLDVFWACKEEIWQLIKNPFQLTNNTSTLPNNTFTDIEPTCEHKIKPTRSRARPFSEMVRKFMLKKGCLPMDLEASCYSVKGNLSVPTGDTPPWSQKTGIKIKNMIKQIHTKLAKLHKHKKVKTPNVYRNNIMKNIKSSIIRNVREVQEGKKDFPVTLRIENKPPAKGIPYINRFLARTKELQKKTENKNRIATPKMALPIQNSQCAGPNYVSMYPQFTYVPVPVCNIVWIPSICQRRCTTQCVNQLVPGSPGVAVARKANDVRKLTPQAKDNTQSQGLNKAIY